MDPMTIALIASAVMGNAKSNESWKNYQSQQGIQAVKDRTAGLTGRGGQNVATPSMVDPMFQSLLTGAMMGQQMKKGANTTGGDGATNAQQPGAMVGAPGSSQSFAAAQNPYQSNADQSMQQRFPFAYPQQG